jgi:phosphoribosylformylglycinamidine synthase
VVVSIEKDKEELLKNHVESVGLDWLLLGKVKGEPELIVKLYEEPILKERVEDLEKLWRDSLANML